MTRVGLVPRIVNIVRSLDVEGWWLDGRMSDDQEVIGFCQSHRQKVLDARWYSHDGIRSSVVLYVEWHRDAIQAVRVETRHDGDWSPSSVQEVARALVAVGSVVQRIEQALGMRAPSMPEVEAERSTAWDRLLLDEVSP